MVHLKDSIKIDTKLILKLGNACLNYIIIFVHDCEMLNIFFFLFVYCKLQHCLPF